MGIIRACGKRVPGGVYLTTPLSSTGQNIDTFLFDPPWAPQEGEAQEILSHVSALGVSIARGNVWDWIGAENYPFFPDFWEEARRFGFSRKVSPSLDFSLLTRNSALIGIHPKGLSLFPEPPGVSRIYATRVSGTGEPECQRLTFGELEHPEENPDEMCTSLLWQLIDDGAVINRKHEIIMPRKYREPGEIMFKYIGAAPPDGVVLHWVPAAMFAVPIHGIEIIEDNIEGKHEERYHKISTSGTALPVSVVKE